MYRCKINWETDISVDDIIKRFESTGKKYYGTSIQTLIIYLYNLLNKIKFLFLWVINLTKF